MRVDLHMHSTCSDGRMRPRDLIAAAHAGGLEIAALTDHDTMAGHVEASAAAAAVGLRLVAGVEVTTSLASAELHVLGYFRAPPTGDFVEFLIAARTARTQRILGGLERLAARGVVVTPAEVRRHARGAVLSRSHVATVLVERKVVPNAERAFARYLGEAHQVFDPTPTTPAEACAAIHAAGGVAIWAHPGASRAAETLPQLLAAGIDGLEACTASGGCDAALLALADQHGLLVSGGSDWHGHGQKRMRRWAVESERIKDLLDRLL